MGSQVAERGIIDLDMKGLVSPAERHAIGAEIEGERPGDVLISQVRDFAESGGFTSLRAEQEAKEAAEVALEDESRMTAAARTVQAIEAGKAKIGEELKDDHAVDGDR